MIWASFCPKIINNPFETGNPINIPCVQDRVVHGSGGAEDTRASASDEELVDHAEGTEEEGSKAVGRER